MRNLYREFGRRLRDARLAAGLTQEALAQQIGVGRTSVTNIECGAQQVSLRTLYAIAAALDTAPTALLPDPDPEEDLQLAPELRAWEGDEQTGEWMRDILRPIADADETEAKGDA